MSTEVEVELLSLREELSRLQNDLQEARQDEANLDEAFQDYSSGLIRSEYRMMVDALSQQMPPKKKVPFPLLCHSGDKPIGETAGEMIEIPPAPEAFVFMSLMQLSADDDIGLSVLTDRLLYVKDLTMTHIEELVLMIPKIGASVLSSTRARLIQTIASRVVKGISSGGWDPSASVYGALGAVLSKKPNVNVQHSSIDLLVTLMATTALANISKWPAHNVASLAFFLSLHSTIPAVGNFLLCLSGWLQANSYSEDVHNVHILALILGALRQANVPLPPNLVSSLTATAERAVNSTKTPTSPQDLHLLAIELAAIKARGVGSLWSALIDRLVHGGIAMFEVPNTVEAVIAMGYTHDAIFSNLQHLKRYMQTPEFNSQVMGNILKNVCEIGERSVAVLRLLYERKDLIEHDVECFWHFLAATAVVSAQGTSVSEGILLFKKQDQFSHVEVLTSSKRLLVNLALAPNLVSAGLVQAASIQAMEQYRNEIQDKQLDRIKSLVHMLGYAEPEAVQFNFLSEGVFVDVAFVKEKIAFVVEPEPIFSITLKRYILRGWTNLRTSVLTRKGWKVHTWIPDTYLDDKSGLAFLAECLKRVPINLVIPVQSAEEVKNIRTGQKAKSMVVSGLSQVDVAKLFLIVLRGNITLDILDLSSLRLTDHMSEVLSEFLMTYISKFPLTRLDVSHNLLTDAFMHRILYGLKTLQSTATRQIEIHVAGNKITTALPPAEATAPIKVALGPNLTGASDTPGISVYVVGAVTPQTSE